MKVLTRYAVKGVIESTYAAGGTPTTTDGILPTANIDPALSYLFDGTRGPSPLGGQFSRAAQTGLGTEFDFPMHCYTPGVAYSATVRPSVDKMLRAAGFAVTTVLTGGAESHTYAPSNAAYESLFLQVFRGAMQYDVKGVYNDFNFAVDGPGLPVWTFPVRGIGVLPVDIATPTDTTYPNLATQKPANAINVALTIGAFVNGVVRSTSFALNRELTPRANENSPTGHMGYAPGAWDPRFTVVFEAEALGTLAPSVINPYLLRDQGTEFAFSMRFGAAAGPGQYKRYTFNMPKAQIINVNDADDGPLATWEVEIGGAVTPGALPNDFTIVFD